MFIAMIDDSRLLSSCSMCILDRLSQFPGEQGVGQMANVLSMVPSASIIAPQKAVV